MDIYSFTAYGIQCMLANKIRQIIDLRIVDIFQKCCHTITFFYKDINKLF